MRRDLRKTLPIRLLVLFLAFALNGCGGGAGVDTTSVPSGSTAASTAAAPTDYPVTISSEVPPGATRLQISGDDVEGNSVFSQTVTAARSVTVMVPAAAATLDLAYVNDGGGVVARYAESAVNRNTADFTAGIVDPPLVLASLSPSAAKSVQATVVSGDDVAFSFAFLGCNRAKVAGDDPRFPGQINATEKLSTANASQLRQHVEDIMSLTRRPRYLFLCGDVVTKGKSNGEDDLAIAAMGQSVQQEMANWKTLRAYGDTVVNPAGVTVSAQPPAAPGSLLSRVKIVVMPGNHEMCYKLNNDPHPPPAGSGYDYEYPYKSAGARFVAELGGFTYGTDGPSSDVVYDVGNPLGLFDSPDGAHRDESRLSYTFRDPDAPENMFIVLNTDTYVGKSTWDGASGDLNISRIPLRWLREKLAAAQADDTVRHIFVFGHRPISSINSESGIDRRQATQFYKLLNNPSARNAAELDTPPAGTPPTKVRGYFCAHAHLFSTKQPGTRAVQQIVCGAGGSEPDPAPFDEGPRQGVTAGKPYPWFGFSVVVVREGTSFEEVDLAFFGRNVHPSHNADGTIKTPGVWWEQEPLKQRGPDISGPSPAPSKVPKELRVLYRRAR